MRDMIQEYEERKVDIPRLDPTVEEFIKHHANLAIERYQDEKTDAIYEIVGHTGPDHYCFSKETIINTKDGKKRICDIKTSDLIDTALGYRNIIRLWENGEKETCLYEINGIHLWSTSNHKIWTIEGFKEISYLSNEDVCYFEDGFVKQINIKDTGFRKKEIVYDIEVNEVHQYFANGILVSNSHADNYAKIGFDRFVNNLREGGSGAGVINRINNGMPNIIEDPVHPLLK
jgi:hypothetical protein